MQSPLSTAHYAHGTIDSLFTTVALQHPDAIAVQFESSVSLTYRELHNQMLQVSAALAPRICHGQPVPVLLPRSPLQVAVILALSHLGAIYVPLDPELPPNLLHDLLDRVDSPVIITNSLPSWSIPTWCHELEDHTVLDLSNILPTIGGSEVQRVLSRNVRPDSVAAILFTSGSTGKPKGVVLTHRNLIDPAKTLSRFESIGLGSRVFQFASFTSNVHMIDILSALLHGACLCQVSQEKMLDRLAHWVRTMQADTIHLTPSVLETMEPDDVPSVRYVVTCSEPVSAAVVSTWSTKVILRNLYGSCEASSIASRVLSPGISLTDVGQVSPHAHIKILDPLSHNQVPAGKLGEIFAAGTSVAEGYWRDSKRTAKSFFLQDQDSNNFSLTATSQPSSLEPVWYATGDLGYVSESGDLHLLARTDNQFKVNGLPLEVVAIEHILRRHVARAVVLARTDDIGHFRFFAFVATQQALVTPDESVEIDECLSATELRSYLLTKCREFLPGYMVPEILVVNAIPQNRSYKIDRQRLCDILDSYFAREKDLLTPVHAPDLLSRITSIVNHRLQRTVPVDEDLRNWGLSYVDAMYIIWAIFEITGKRIFLRDVLHNPTVEHLVRLTEGAEETPSFCSNEHAACTRFIASPSQRSIFGAHKTLRNGAYNLNFAYHLKSPQLDVLRFFDAVRLVCSEHESLRSTYELNDDSQVVGVIHPPQDMPPVLSFTQFTELCELSGTHELSTAKHRARQLINEVGEEYVDVSSASPLRVTVYEIAPMGQEMIIHFRVHNLSIDELSFERLIHHVFDVYRSGSTCIDTTKLLSYPEYVIRQNRSMIHRQEQDRSWWSNWANVSWSESLSEALLSRQGETPRLAIRNPSQNRSSIYYHPLSMPDVEACISHRHRASTRFDFWLSFVQIFLARLASQSRFLLGVPTSMRFEDPCFLNVMGCCVATAILPVVVDTSESFRAVLDKIHEFYWQCVHHTQPTEDVLQWLSVPGAGNAEVEVLYVYHDRNGARHLLKEGTAADIVDKVDIATGSGHHPLVIHVDESGSEPRLILEYDPVKFRPEFIASICDSFHSMIHWIAAHGSNITVADIPFCGKEMEEKAFAQSVTAIPSHLSSRFLNGRAAYIQDLVFDSVDRSPDSLAIEAPEGPLTYAALGSRVLGLAGELKKTGLRPRMRVALFLEKSTDYVIAMLAVLSAGSTFTILDIHDKPSVNQSKIETVSPQFIITNRGSGQLAKQLLLPPTSSIFDLNLHDTTMHSRLHSRSHSLIDSPTTASPRDAPAYIGFTSGSTAAPKCFQVNHAAAAVSILNQIDACGFKVNDRIPMLTNVTFDASLLEVLATLSAGATLVAAPHDRFISDLAGTLNEFNVSHVFATPTTIACLDGPSQVPSIRCIILGGEPTPKNIFHRWTGRVTILGSYGSAETTIATHGFTMWEPSHSDQRGSCIGKPVSSVKAAILDEIPHKLDQLSAGYLNEGHDNGRFIEHKILGRTFDTGDLCYFDRKGYFYLRGRADDQVKSNGFWFNLSEVESTVDRCLLPSQIQAAVLIARHNEDGSLDMVAFICQNHFSKRESVRLASVLSLDDHRTVDELITLRSKVSDALPSAMVPRYWVPLSDIPQGPTGKINRQLLKEWFLILHESGFSEKYASLMHPPVIKQEKTMLAQSLIDSELYASQLLLKFIGSMDAFCLQEAWMRVCQAHPSLRTCYIHLDGGINEFFAIEKETAQSVTGFSVADHIPLGPDELEKSLSEIRKSALTISKTTTAYQGQHLQPDISFSAVSASHLSRDRSKAEAFWRDQRVQSRAIDYRVTLPTLFQAALGISLARVTGATKPLFWTVTSGRELDVSCSLSAVANFLNVVPCVVPVGAEYRIRHLLHHLHAASDEAFPHSWLPTSSILPFLRNQTGVKTLLAIDNHEIPRVTFEEGLRVESIERREFTHVPFTVIGVATRLLDTFVEITEGISSYDVTEVMVGDIVSDEQYFEKDYVLQQIRSVNAENSKLSQSSNDTLVSLFQRSMKANPRASALYTRGLSLTYQQLDELSSRLARHLLRFTQGRRMIVPILFPRKPDMIIAMLAVLKAGAAYCPLDMSSPPSRLDYIIREVNASVILTDDAGFSVMSAELNLGLQIVNLDSLRWTFYDNDEAVLPEVSPTTPCYVLFTSGSTGEPKGCILSHGAVASSIKAALPAFQLDATDRVLLFANYIFDASVIDIYGTLSKGAALIIVPDDDVKVDLCKTINDLRVTFVHLTPTTAQLLDVGRVRFIGNYGPTETAVQVAVSVFERPSLDGTFYKALPGNVIAIINEQGKVAREGEQGEIYIGGQQLFDGYLKDAISTRGSLLKIPSLGDFLFYRSGDRGRYMKNMGIEILGRLDDQMKFMGQRVEPAEIETVLNDAPGVALSAVVVVSGGLHAALQRKRAPRLPASMGNASICSPIYIEASPNAITTVTSIVSRILALPVEDIHKPLDHLGLNSLGFVQLHQMIHMELGVLVPYSKLRDARSIDGICRWLFEAAPELLLQKKAGQVVASSVTYPGRYPATPIQENIWMSQTKLSNTTYAVERVFKVHDVSVPKLVETLNDLIYQIVHPYPQTKIGVQFFPSDLGPVFETPNLHLKTGPLSSFQVHESPDGQIYLHAAVHHILFDEFTINIDDYRSTVDFHGITPGHAKVLRELWTQRLNGISTLRRDHSVLQDQTYLNSHALRDSSTLLALFQATLHRTFMTDEVVLSIPLKYNDSWSNFISRTFENLEFASQNGVPVNWICSWLKIELSDFPVHFVLHQTNPQGRSSLLQDRTFDMIPPKQPAFNFEFHLFLSETGFDILVDYNPLIFGSQLVQDVVDTYADLLASVQQRSSLDLSEFVDLSSSSSNRKSICASEFTPPSSVSTLSVSPAFGPQTRKALASYTQQRFYLLQQVFGDASYSLPSVHEDLWQVTSDKTEFAFSIHDLRDRSYHNAWNRMVQLCQDDANKPFDLGNPPLIRCHGFQLPGIVFDYHDISASERKILSDQSYVSASRHHWQSALAQGPAIKVHSTFDITTATIPWAHEIGATSFSKFLSVFMLTMLLRYDCKSPTVLIPVSNRPVETEKTIYGCFTNILPIRVALDAHLPVLDNTKRVVRAVNEALVYSQTPFEKVLEYAGVSRNDFEAMFVYHEGSRNIGVFRPAAHVLESQGSTTLDVKIEYDPRVLVEYEAENLAESFHQVLLSLHGTHDPAFTTTNSLGFLSDVETRLLESFHGPKQPEVDREPLVHDQIMNMASEFPHRTAVSFDGEESCTYEQLQVRVASLVSWIQQQDVHIEGEATICIFSDACVDRIICILAIMQLGLAYVPLSVQDPIHRTMAIIQDCKPQAILVPSTGTFAHWSKVQDLQRELQIHVLETVPCFIIPENIPQITDAVPMSPHVHQHPSNIACVLYTSGPTSLTKGVAIDHQALRNSITQHRSIYRLQPRSRLLQLAPYTFDVSVVDIFSTLSAGATLVIGRHEFLLSNLQQVVRDWEITHIATTPTVATLLAPALSPSLQVLALGETTVNVVSREMFRTTPVSDVGRVGQLAIGGVQVAHGYLRPQSGKSAFITHDHLGKIYLTGDLAKFTTTGDIILLGRTDSQIKREIEAILSKENNVSVSTVSSAKWSFIS
ncbi:hypothetical protein DTO280E4_3543 [Paecilomyces variotii]|nr:hypothetical protein DTO280E4_3543 [Paecilomyces variotii]